jgi:hypothetical protein
LLWVLGSGKKSSTLIAKSSKQKKEYKETEDRRKTGSGCRVLGTGAGLLGFAGSIESIGF